MKTITVGIKWRDQIYDLKLPTQVSFKRVKELICESFSMMNQELPSHFDLQVTNKLIAFYDDDQIADFPLGNGDQLEIVGRKK